MHLPPSPQPHLFASSSHTSPPTTTLQNSENVVAIDLITEHMRLKLRQHDLIRIYANLEVR